MVGEPNHQSMRECLFRDRDQDSSSQSPHSISPVG
jgi:hypothetical protein